MVYTIFMLEEQIGYQTFGRKAYWLFLSKYLEAPAGFLLIAFLFSLAGRSSLVPVELKKAVSAGSLICLAVAIVSTVIAVVSSRITFKCQEFSLTADAFKLRQGVFRKHEIAIPYRQIQNVEIERTLYQQMFGVSRLVISTGGEDDLKTPEDEARAVLQDIDKDVAVTLQNDLLQRADVQRVVSSGPLADK